MSEQTETKTQKRANVFTLNKELGELRKEVAGLKQDVQDKIFRLATFVDALKDQVLSVSADSGKPQESKRNTTFSARG